MKLKKKFFFRHKIYIYGSDRFSTSVKVLIDISETCRAAQILFIVGKTYPVES